MIFRSILSILLVCIVQTSLAEQWSFDFKIRERFEIWDGLNKKTYGDQSINAKGKKQGESNDRIWLQQLIFGLTYQSNRITAKFHLYDARVWGWSLNQNDFIKNQGSSDEHAMDSYEEYLDLYDAYVKTQLTDKLSLQIGRQSIWYGDRHLLSPSAWVNGISWLWDAARFSYKNQQHFFDIWYGQSKTRDPNSFSLTSKHAHQSIGIYSHYHFAPKGAIEPFFIWKNDLFYNNGKKEDSYFLGFRLYDEDLHNFIYDITAVKETGVFQRKENADLNIDAYGYLIQLGYTFKNLPMSPKFVIARMYGSGDNNPDNNEITAFNRPFGATDGSRWGRMDLMSWGNVVDHQMNLYLKSHPKFDLKMAYHRFYLAEKEDSWNYYKYQVADNQYDHIGDETDFILKYSHSKSLKLLCIYAYFNAGDFITKNNIAENDASRFMFQIQYQWF